MPNSKLFDPYTYKACGLGIGQETSRQYFSAFHGNGQATLHEPTIKAILDFMKADDVAVGKKGDYLVAECGNSENLVYVVHSPVTNGFFASRFKNGVKTAYKLSRWDDNGSELLLSMLPIFLEDQEFAVNYENAKTIIDSFSDEDENMEALKSNDELRKSLFIMCDNVYNRIHKEGLAKISSNNITPLSDMALQADTYMPDEVIVGRFTMFSQPNEEEISIEQLSDFRLNEREWTEAEKNLIPNLPEWYVVPKYVVSACKMVTAQNLARPVRNLLFRGEAGTGKTEAAKAMAAALHLPYVSITCNPDMQISDFLGNIMPVLENEKTSESVPTDFEIPSFQDIDMDAAYAYNILTGNEAPENITGDDILKLLMEKSVQNAKKNSNGVTYKYYDSALIRAIKNGWLCEIQEPAVIERPGVLVGLNSLLDTCQTVTLPTGEVIQRHPDCVLVVTTNTSYQGCKELNNSVLSRMQFKQDTEMPSETELAERVTKITGFDKPELLEMIKVINEIKNFCLSRMITDGSCGVRELIDWVQATTILGNIVEAANCTIIPSASADVENQAEIRLSCLSTHFTN